MNNIITRSVWGREFELSIVFQNFPGEEVTSYQEAVARTLEDLQLDTALDMIKNYILKWNAEEVGSSDIINIFKYVIPESFLIPRENEKRVAALMCKYKFDMEHGIAVVFENEKIKAVGPQDIIL